MREMRKRMMQKIKVSAEHRITYCTSYWNMITFRYHGNCGSNTIIKLLNCLFNKTPYGLQTCSFCQLQINLEFLKVPKTLIVSVVLKRHCKYAIIACACSVELIFILFPYLMKTLC